MVIKSILTAYLLVATAIVGLTVSDLLFKQILTQGGSVIQLMAMFIPAFLLVMLLLAAFQGGILHHYKLRHPWLMAARSVFVIGFTFLSLWGLSHNPYAQHAMLLQIVPVMTALAAVWMLGERLSVVQWVLAGFCVVGVVLIIDPQLHLASAYLLLPVMAAVCQSVGNVFVARHRTKATALGFTFWGAVGGWSVGMMLWLWQGAPPLAMGLWILTQGIAVIMALSVAMLLAGLQTAAAHGHAGTAGLMMYLQMPTALVLGWLVLNEVPKFNAVAGAAVIVCAGVVLVVMQTRQQYGTKPIPD